MQELYRTLSPVTLSSAKASAGYPNKNSNNEKIESPRGTMGRGKMRKRALSSLFPLPIVPRAHSVSLSPVLPTIQRGLCGGEAPCHDRQWSSKRLPTFYSHVMYGWQFLPAPMYVTFGRLGGRKIKVRRYQFIVVAVFFFCLCHINTRVIEITNQMWISGTSHISTHLWMTPFSCKNCNPAMISAV